MLLPHVCFEISRGQFCIRKYTVYVESDFRGGQDYGFRLRQAYVNARGFLVGQTWSTFVDPAAAPPTIDYEGPMV